MSGAESLLVKYPSPSTSLSLPNKKDDEGQNNIKIDSKRLKEILEYLLNAYRAQLAILNSKASLNCPFDFSSFLQKFHSSNSSILKHELSYLLEQGVLNSLLPFIKTSYKENNLAKCHDVSMSIAKKLSPSIRSNFKNVDKNESVDERKRGFKSPKQHSSVVDTDNEIVIHVCDECQGVWQDFKCSQSLLTREMGYFSRVAVKGQKLGDMDISVHCEIKIFDWLLRWINNPSSTDTKLDGVNVVGLAVSADFLQMPTLTSKCLRFLSDNIESVIAQSPNLGCLSDPLLERLAQSLSNVKLELISKFDPQDRITSRLFIQFILYLNSPTPKVSYGHFASLSLLFRCKYCKKLLTNDYSFRIPCLSLKIDSYGNFYGAHEKDPAFSLPIYIREIKRELRTWRRVYWRLWGTAHFFYCTECEFYYPGKFKAQCRFHPPIKKESNFLNVENENDLETQAQDISRKGFEIKKLSYTKINREEKIVSESESNKTLGVESSPVLEPSFHFRKYWCCQEPVYKFLPFKEASGCKTRDHVPNLSKELKNPGKIEILEEFSSLIVEEEDPLDHALHLKNIVKNRKSPVSQRRASNIEATLLEYKQKSKELEGGKRYSKERSNSCENESNSDEEVENEKNRGSYSLLAQYGFPASLKKVESRALFEISELWDWNPDLSTRYNQDMQRELEEKFMIMLAKNLLKNRKI